MTKSVEPSNSPEAAKPASDQPVSGEGRLSKLSRWLFCPYRRVLIKIVPHHAESVYKLEFSHRHLALAAISAFLLCATLFFAHFAEVRAAEARVRALQAVEAHQRQQLSAFSKQTNMLWQRVGKLQRDDEEIHRLTKVIVPKSPSHPPARKSVAGAPKQFGAVAPSRLSSWRKLTLWVHSLAGVDGLGFAAEAADLSSLTNAVDQTGQQTSALESRIRTAAETKIAAELARDRYLAAIPSMWPTLGYVSSGFGYRSSPDYGFHEGLDIVNDYGAPIYATAAGVVVEAGWYGGFGYRVIIDHGNGLRSMYAHDSRLLVSTGETVKKGQQIATVGATGFATGPHVHYQLELWGRPINPTPYLNGSVKDVALTH